MNDPFAPTEYKTLADVGVKGGNPLARVAMCEQGTAEWFAERLGILTASHADMVVTSTGKRCTSQTRTSYMYGLIGERLTRNIEMQHSTPAMERGVNLEPRAREWYEFTTGRDVAQVGFVHRDAGMKCGCSPDGLCAGRMIEIKCLMRRGHIAALLRGRVPTAHIAQVQFQLWVAGLALCDFVLYTPEPEIPSMIWTVAADPDLHAAYSEAVPEFCAELDVMEEKLRAIK